MSRNQEFGESFGLSRQEQSEMAGRALGGHIFDAVNSAMGDYRTAVRSAAYDRMRLSGYGPEDIKSHETDGEYVEHRSGPYRARWFGGDYADIHHRTDPGQAIDTLNVGPEPHPDKGSQIQSALEDWHRQVRETYR